MTARHIGVSWAIAALLVTASVANAGKDDAPRGRWLFRYDLPPPPPEMGEPDLVGVIQEIGQGDTRRWSLRLRVREPDGTTRTVYVVDDTRIDGHLASRGREWLQKDVPIAVFGGKRLGRFYAEMIFTIAPQDWEEVKADYREATGEAAEARAATAPRGWVAAPTSVEPEYAWPEKPWEPKHPVTVVAPAAPETPEVGETPQPEPAAKPRAEAAAEQPQVVAQIYSQRGDFVGKIVGIRNHGRELSVRTPRKVMLVLLDDATAISRGERELKPADLAKGDIVDVDASGWLGAQSCTAKRVWVVEVK